MSSGASQRDWRRRRQLYGLQLVDATGTHRRLRALATVGWSIKALECTAGLDRYALDGLRDSPKVSYERSMQVRRLYDELWDKQAPEGASSIQAKAAARKSGWPPPAAWDDDEIDDPTAKPHGCAAIRKPGTCRNGHPFDSYKTASNGRKWGICLTCRRAADRQRARRAA